MRTLSGGNQQRVVLARELSHRPAVLVAAQPTRGLDVGAIEYMSTRLRAAAADGIGVLLISTELDEILDLADRIVVLSRGRVIGDARPGRRDARPPRTADGRGHRRCLRRRRRRRAVRRPGAASPRGACAARSRGAPDWLVAVGLYALCVGVALVASAVLVAVTGGPWSTVLSALVDGSVRNPGRWGATLAEAAPILIVALGAIVSTRAGLVNIGQEGQLAIGAACAAFVAHAGVRGRRPARRAGRRRRRRGGVGRHRRRAPLLAQGAGGDHHAAAGVRRRPAHRLRAHPAVPAARPRPEPAQPHADERPARRRHPPADDPAVRQRVPGHRRDRARCWPSPPRC